MFTAQRRVMRAAGLKPWLLGPPILIGLLISALYIITAICNARLFTELLGERDTATLTTLIAVVVCLLLVRPLVDVLGQLLQNRVGLMVKRNLRMALLTQLDRQGPMRAGLGRAGNIQSTLTDGVESVEPYFVRYLTQLAVTTITAGSLAIGLATISPLIAVVLLICGVGIVAVPRLWDRALADRGQTHWIAYEDLNADFIDAMMGMSTLKSFGAADDYGKRLRQQSEHLLASTLGQLRLSLGETGISGAMKVLGPALGLLIAIIQVRNGHMHVAELFTITLLSVEMFRPFTQLSACWHESFFGISALSSMDDLLTRSDAPGETFDRTVRIDAGDADIVFSEVDYQYIGTEKKALSGCTFTISPGRMTALVGLSGSGKSTVLGLMMGFDSPVSGTVRIGGCDPRDVEVSATVALVPQDPIIFPGTIHDILTAANPEADEQTMREALRIARADHLHQESDTDEQGKDVLDLHILEHAQNLSGGQKQRLAIARSLVRNTPVLVLDESTSALDTHTEHELLQELRTVRPELTLVLVTHRIDTASKADHVVVLEGGEVSCDGSPQALSADPTTAFARLVATQLGGPGR